MMDVKTSFDDCPCCGASGAKFDDASGFEDGRHRYQCVEDSCPIEMYTVAPEYEGDA